MRITPREGPTPSPATMKKDTEKTDGHTATVLAITSVANSLAVDKNGLPVSNANEMLEILHKQFGNRFYQFLKPELKPIAKQLYPDIEEKI